MHTSPGPHNISPCLMGRHEDDRQKKRKCSRKDLQGHFPRIRGKEIQELAGHLNFALMATSGKTSYSFARTIYCAVPGGIEAQPPHVYRALQWLEAIFQHPPCRIEEDEREKRHVLLPDGYWDPDQKQGGVGAVLLREGQCPLTFGGMTPPHLAYQLLYMQETDEEKKQRNTQAELLAILMSILMWHQSLKGCSLLILTDSTSAKENCESGTSADQQSRDLVSLILLFSNIFGIHLWFEWVPSKQNPGDPYSRPLTAAVEAVDLDNLFKAERWDPIWPSFLRSSPSSWRSVWSSPTSLKDWSVSK